MPKFREILTLLHRLVVILPCDISVIESRGLRISLPARSQIRVIHVHLRASESKLVLKLLLVILCISCRGSKFAMIKEL